MEETEELKDGMDNMVNDSSAVIDNISEDNEEDNYMEEQTSEKWYSITILVLAVVGLAINITAVIIMRKKKGIFHTMLKILAFYDMVVVVGCCALYSLPQQWQWFGEVAYPRMIPILLPLVQIAMMTSVYCTVVMSFERYIRICHICQMQQSAFNITNENVWKYIFAFIVCPIVFYVPRFFEIRSFDAIHSYNQTLNCSSLFSPHSGFHFDALKVKASMYLVVATDDKSGNIDIEFESIEDDIHENNEIGRYFKIKTMQTVNKKEHDISSVLSFNRGKDNYEKFIAKVDPTTDNAASLQNEIENFSSQGIINRITSDNVVVKRLSGKRNLTTDPECLLQQFLISEEGEIDSFFIKLMQEEYIDIEATSLRKNKWYYKIYCIILNTLFAALIPLLSLIYLNIRTVLALRKMRKLDQVASKIRTNFRKNAHRRSYRLPISIYKLKHLIMKPRDEEEEENENKRLGRAKELRNGEDFHNQAEEYERILNQTEERHSIAEIRSTPGSIRQDLELGELRTGITDAKIEIDRPLLTVPTSKYSILSTENQQCLCSNQSIVTTINEEDSEATKDITESSATIQDLVKNVSARNTLIVENVDNVSVVSGQSNRSEEINKREVANKRTRINSRKMLRDEGTKTNSQICLNISNEQNKTKISVENRLTRISLGIVYLFIVCHIWRLIPTVYEAFFSKDGTVLSEWPKWLFHVYHLSHTLIVFNSAVNFILYVVR